MAEDIELLRLRAKAKLKLRQMQSQPAQDTSQVQPPTVQPQEPQPEESWAARTAKALAPLSYGVSQQPAPERKPYDTTKRPSSFADMAGATQDPSMGFAPALDALTLPARALATTRGMEMSDPSANFFNPEAEQTRQNAQARNEANPWNGRVPTNFADFGRNANSAPGEMALSMAGDPLTWVGPGLAGAAKVLPKVANATGKGLEAVGESQMRRVMKPLIRHERKAPKPTEQVIFEYGLDQGAGGSNPRIVHERVGNKLDQLGEEVQKRIKTGPAAKIRVNTDEIIDEVTAEFMANPGGSKDFYKIKPYLDNLAEKFKKIAAESSPNGVGDLDLWQAKNFQRFMGDEGAWEQLAIAKGIPVKAKKSAKSALAERIYHKLGDHIDEAVPEGLKDLNRQINELIPVHQVTGWRKVISERQSPISGKNFVGAIAATLNPKVWPILAMNAVSESATAASKIYRLGEKLRTAKTPADQARYANALKKIGLTDEEIRASMEIVENSGGKGAFEAQDLRVSPPINIPEPRRQPPSAAAKSQAAPRGPIGPRQSIAANYKVALPEAEGLTSPINPQMTEYDPLEAMNPFSRQIQPPMAERQPVGYGVEDLAPIPRIEQEVYKGLERNIPDIREGEPVLGDWHGSPIAKREIPPDLESGSIVRTPKPKPPAPTEQVKVITNKPTDAPGPQGGLEWQIAGVRRRQAEKYLRYSLKREPKPPELAKFLQDHSDKDIPKPPERQIISREFKGRRTGRELDGMENLLQNGDPEWSTNQIPVNQAPESFTIGGMELKRTKGAWDNQIVYKDRQGKKYTFRGDEQIHMDAPKQAEAPRVLEQSPPPKDDFYDDNGQPLFQSSNFEEQSAKDLGYRSLGNGKYEKNGKTYEWSRGKNWFDTPKPNKRTRINSAESTSDKMWETVQKEFPETDFEHSYDKSNLSESRYITVSKNGKDVNIRISGHERYNKTYSQPDIDIRVSKNESENIARIKEAISKAKKILDDEKTETLFQSAHEAGIPEGRKTTAIVEKAAKAWKEKGTDSPFFKKWFGKSKVVDETGNPQILFHGTAESGLKGNRFDKNYLGSVTKSKSAEQGFFFVSDKNVARGYSRFANEKPVADLIAQSERAERQGKWSEANRLMAKAEKLESTHRPSENIIEAYVSVKTPYEFDADNQRFLDIEDDIHDAIAKAKAGGHDGIVFRNLIDNADWGSDDAADHWMIFDPKQIKSATSNRGTFDPQDPSILNQADKLFSPKGQIVRRDGKSSITLYKGKADASTAMHEHAHWLRTRILNEGEAERALRAIGEKEWNREAEEYFAKGFEKYLFRGESPIEGLKPSFEAMKKSMRKIYLNGEMDDLPQGLKEVYDAIFIRNQKISKRAENILYKIATSNKGQKVALMMALKKELGTKEGGKK